MTHFTHYHLPQLLDLVYGRTNQSNPIRANGREGCKQRRVHDSIYALAVVPFQKGFTGTVISGLEGPGGSRVRHRRTMTLLSPSRTPSTPLGGSTEILPLDLIC